MKHPWLKRLLSVHGLLFLFFVYAPIIIVVVYSFNSHPVNMMVWKDFTLDWYLSIFGHPTKLTEQTLYVESTDQLLSALQNSLLVAASTTTFATIVGTTTASGCLPTSIPVKTFLPGPALHADGNARHRAWNCIVSVFRKLQHKTRAYVDHDWALHVSHILCFCRSKCPLGRNG